MKKLKLCAIILLMIVPPIFAQKPQGSEIPNSLAADLKLIIESNERGKIAQAKIPLLKAKIDTLESIVEKQARLINSRDSTITDQETQVAAFQTIYQNSQTIISNKDQEIATINQQLKQMTKNYRNQKRKTVFVGVVLGVFSGTLAYFFSR
jgi:uncharacterized protein (DUF3084 family)